MILEDFFTLSEMKDGLGAANRVKELISVMREQKDCSANNITDAFRQWSTVAQILATTESKDCLECFVQFDGLWYLNHWLQEAQKHGSDGCDDSVSKLINYILGALDRLPVDKEVLVSSRLGLTLRQVISETDVFLQEKRRKLLGKWEFMGEEIKDQDHKKHGSWHIVELKASASLMEEGVQSMKATNSPHSISSPKVAVDGVLCCRQSADKFDHMDAKSCQLSAEVVGTSNMDTIVSNRQNQQSASNCGGATVVSGDMNSLASSNVSNPCQESMSIAEESSACFVARTSSGMVNSFAVDKIVIGRSDFSDIKDMSNILKDDEVYVHRAETNLFKSKSKEESVTSCPVLSSSTWNLVPISTELCTLGSKETENPSVNVCDSELKTVTVDERLPTCSKTRKEENASSEKSDGQLEAACEDSCGETSGGTKKISSSFLKADKEMDLRKRYGYNNAFTRRADMELEFQDDALEVAVQVAIEAEREVADRERCSLSSQEGKSDGEVVDSGCSGPEANKSDQLNSCLCPSNLDHSDGNSSPGKKGSCTGGSKIDQTARGHDSESPLSTSIIQHSLENTKENRCIFDLNEGVDSEDANHSPLPAHQNLSAPVAVVATTRGSPNLPVTCPHFNGESGWKGSAATSAFRPASPKKAPEYVQISSNNEKCNLFEFDLNVADHGNDVVADPIFTKSLPMSEPNSRSSPLEISSKREERVILDLNSPGDENVSPEASSYVSHHDQKSENGTGYQLPSSSLLAKHASFRDIDLNDTPAFDVSDPPSTIKTSSKASSTSESRDLGDPDVVILGSRVSNVRRDPFNHSWHSSMRGFHMEPSMGVRASSPMVYPYMPANGYGYNGAGMGPHTMALHPSPYGPGSLPYMVDSRGVTVMPQVVGSSTGFSGPPTPRPFLIAAAGNTFGAGIASNSLGSSASGSPRPLMDLNSGTFSYDSSREYGSFGNSYVQGHHGWTEEQVKHGPHSVNGSGMGLKRKEPDPNWEAHTIAYKHMHSWN